ncbi:MAG: hypothetical protein Q4D81_00520 [Eubacteriales bacterium]|nr:hypothetical protein [Eubacteriales bacterium]
MLDMWALPVPLLATLASGLRDDSRIKMRMAGVKHIPAVFVLPQIRDQIACVFAKKGEKPRLLTEIMTRAEKKETRAARTFRSGADFDKAWKAAVRSLNNG